MSSGSRLPGGQVDENEGDFRSPSPHTIGGQQGSRNMMDNQFMTPSMSQSLVVTNGRRVRDGENDRDGVGSGEEPVENVGGSTSHDTHRKKKKYHRHTPYQTQELENFFMTCPHPNDMERKALGSDLALDPLQVKFWFQNKRTQIKTQHERHQNTQLRVENEMIRAENTRLRETLGDTVCVACGGPTAVIGDLSFDEHHLRMENARLKDEIDRMTVVAARCKDPWVSQTGTSENGVTGRELSESVQHNKHVVGPILDVEKQVIAEVAYTAMNEFVRMTQTLEPLWVPVAIDGYTTYFLNEDEYFRSLFRVSPRKPGFRTEATRDYAIVKANLTDLLNILMNVNQWANLFCAIVAKAKPLELLATGPDGSFNGALQLLNVEYQMITPFVPTRETFMARYCKQHGEGIWAVVDVSLDGSNANSFRKRPSGCVIQQLPNGYLKITWVEHVEVVQTGSNGIFRSVISSGAAFGAKYWLSILNGQFERFSCCAAVEIPLNDVNNFEGRKGLLKLAERMVIEFCSRVGASSANSWTTLSHCGRDEIKVITNKNVNEHSRFNGIVISVATSIWLPAAPKRVFDFFCDENNRAKWDILSNGAEIYQMASITTGEQVGNIIKLCRVNGMSVPPNSMLILQESFAYQTGFFIVYSPIDLSAMSGLLDNGDTNGLPLLPSGFAVLSDGSGGSLLTLSLQVLVDAAVNSKLSIADVETVNGLMTGTLARIRAFFGVPYNSE